jgi:hypothetical protein
MTTIDNRPLDELDVWLFLAIDAGYSFATNCAPLPIGDPGLETRIAEALERWKERNGYVDDLPWKRPAWLSALFERPGGEAWNNDIEGAS